MKTTSLSLLAFLPALTFAFFLPFPIPAHNAKSTAEISPDDVCAFIHYIDNELCTANLESNQENVHTSHHVTKEVINNVVYYHYPDQKFDPKELCPLIELVDKTFCKSDMGTLFVNTDKIDPKDLCPLLEAIDIKLCS